jgi:predicted component of type VI protein secretion system
MLIRKNSDAAEEIIQSRCPGKKVRISYYSQNGNEPDSVIISHFNIKLDIHLSKINENK